MKNTFDIPHIVSTNNTFKVENVKDQIVKTLDKYYELVDKQKELRYKFFKMNSYKINERNKIKSELSIIYRNIIAIENELHRLIGMHIINYNEMI